MRFDTFDPTIAGGGCALNPPKLGPDDLLSRQAYLDIRTPWRRRVSMLKALQRVELGQRATLLLETRETVLHHIHEVLHLEGRFERGLWRHELEEYSRLIPSRGEICATLFLHAQNAGWVRGLAESIISGQPVIGADFAGQRVTAESIDRHQDDEAPVQYLRFSFSVALSPKPVVFWLNHEGVRSARRVILPRSLLENDNHH